MGISVVINGKNVTEIEFDETTLPQPSFEYNMGRVRDKRNNLLSESDWTQTVDSPLTDAQKYAWAEYRQQLRDLPSTLTTQEDIDNLTWPTLSE